MKEVKLKNIIKKKSLKKNIHSPVKIGHRSIYFLEMFFSSFSIYIELQNKEALYSTPLEISIVIVIKIIGLKTAADKQYRSGNNVKKEESIHNVKKKGSYRCFFALSCKIRKSPNGV